MKPAPFRRLLPMTISLLLPAAAILAPSVSAAAPWAPGVSYPTNSRATYGVPPFNIEYSSRQSHTSQNGWEPPSVPALWEIPTPPNCVFWTPQVKYTLNTLVVHSNTNYKAIQAHNSQSDWAPSSTPALWTAVSSSNCSVAAAETYKQAHNQPPHHSGLSVSAGSTTTATFQHSGKLLKADLFFTTPDAFSFNFFVMNSAETWVKFGSATQTGPSFNASVMSSFGLQKGNVVLALSEVMSDNSVLTALLPRLPGCKNTARGVFNGVFTIAKAAINEASSRLYGYFVESSAWDVLGDRCVVEGGCKQELECLLPGGPLGGKAECIADKGFKNQCIRDPNNRKVICREFDEKGKLINESAACCNGPCQLE